MFNFLKKAIHKHNWIVDEDNSMKRRCQCGEEEWVFSNPYPAIGVPKYEWKSTTLPKLNWL